LKQSLKSRAKKIEKKLNLQPREYPIVVHQGREHEAEEEKKRILEKDPDATFWELHIVWA
jgi:hypothetical protein